MSHIKPISVLKYQTELHLPQQFDWLFFSLPFKVTMAVDQNKSSNSRHELLFVEDES